MTDRELEIFVVKFNCNYVKPKVKKSKESK